jgi:tRNA(fMet)-specific endonuclease VapC
VVKYALDSNTVSYALRAEGRVAQRLRAVGPTSIHLPAVVVYEVNFGLRRVQRQAQLTAFAAMVRTVDVLAFDVEAADHAARIRLALEAAGTPIGAHDLLIAATARRHGCVLVTHNMREFSRVPDLVVEDWY